MTVTVPDPVPPAGLTVAQIDVPNAVQLHEESLAVTVRLVVPPVAVMEPEVAESPYVHVGTPPPLEPPWKENRFETSLWPTPVWPTATTRASYVPSGNGQLGTNVEKSTRILPSVSTAGFPRFTVV